MKVGIAVPVQIMINSKTSGVMFTIDPVTNEKNTIDGIETVEKALYALAGTRGDHLNLGSVTLGAMENQCKTAIFSGFIQFERNLT